MVSSLRRPCPQHIAAANNSVWIGIVQEQLDLLHSSGLADEAQQGVWATVAGSNRGPVLEALASQPHPNIRYLPGDKVRSSRSGQGFSSTTRGIRNPVR